MGIQLVDGKLVYVVEFDTMPVMPIIGVGVEQHYAEALTNALMTGQITKPGKYAIEMNFFANTYSVYEVKE